MYHVELAFFPQWDQTNVPDACQKNLMDMIMAHVGVGIATNFFFLDFYQNTLVGIILIEFIGLHAKNC